MSTKNKYILHFKKLNMELPFDPAIPLLVIYLEELKSGSQRSQRRQWHPTPVLLPGKSHGRRSLVGCSPWGR